MYELNKKTISTLIISILMLSMALSVMPIAVADPGLTVKLSKIPSTVTHAPIELVRTDWATAPGADHGTYSAKFTGIAGTDDAYVRVRPTTTATLATFVPASISFDYWTVAGGKIPELELRFISPNNVDPSGAGHVDITVFYTGLGDGDGAWNTKTVAGTDASSFAYGNYPPGHASAGDSFTYGLGLGKTLAEVIAYLKTTGIVDCSDWKLYEVSPQIWDQTDTKITYVDKVVVGTKTYDLEPSGNVGDTVTVSGTSTTVGGLVQVYWDSVKAWDGTAGLLAEKYAVGTSYTVDVTIPEGKSGNHYVIVKDVEAAESTSTIFVMEPEIALTPKAGLVGDVITVKGTGFGKEVTVTATCAKTGGGVIALTLSPSGLKTSALGSFTATFAVPTNATAGDITATATVSATATLTVGKSITLTPSKGIAGTTVTVSGRGFKASSTVDITWLVTTGYSLLLVNDYPTDSVGAFTTTFTVPPVTTGVDYTITATDAATPTAGTASATFTMTGATAITLSPKSGLGGITVTVTGEWFTKSKTVTVYMDATSLGTVTASSIIPYGFTKTITIPIDATFGTHTIKARDSEGVEATATFTVSERIIVIQTGSTTYMPGDTLSFDIHSTVEFKKTGVTYDDIVIKIYDPDGSLFWSVAWKPVKDADTAKWTVPYSAQIASGFHLTLPSDAKAGLWKWNATYYLTDVVAKVEKTGSFTVKAATASMIDEKITALEESINLLGVQILAAQTAAQAAQTAATTAGTKADAALAAAQAATTAATVAATAATTAGTKADAAMTAAQAATTAAQGAKTSADSATTAANAAKTSADAAKATTDGLTTLVYVAIGASVIAALAAIFAVMQISKKIA